MYSTDDIGEKIISLHDWEIYEIKAVRHVIYESKKTYFVNTYFYIGKQKWINSRNCIFLNNRKSR